MKYRLPKIEEFVDGFTYEVYSEGHFEDSIEDFCGWYEYTIGKNCWRDLEEIENELKNGNIRCKPKDIQPTLQDYIDMMASLEKKREETEDKICIVYTESQYDYLQKELGENCGWDKDKVIVLRGYPKFDVL